MPSSAIQRQQVYLACRFIFSGKNTLLRKRKSIQRCLDFHTHSLQKSIPDYDVKKVVTIVKLLLERQVFQSESHARAEFPGLFISLTTKSEHLDEKQETQIPKLDVICEDISPSEDGEWEDGEFKEQVDAREKRGLEREEDGGYGALEGPLKRRRIRGSSSVLHSSEPYSSPITSVFPVFLPYDVQHSILTTVQACLEYCCFDFARKWLPSHVAKHRWDCAMAVELTKWAKVLPEWTDSLHPDGSQLDKIELMGLFREACQLRNVAVHRVPVAAKRALELVQVAIRLAEVLRDTLRVKHLEALYLEVQSKIHEMEVNAAVLERSFLNRLSEIQVKRGELDREEKELRLGVLKVEKENGQIMSHLIRESVGKVFDAGSYDALEAEDGSLGYVSADEGGEVRHQ